MDAGGLPLASVCTSSSWSRGAFQPVGARGSSGRPDPARRSGPCARRREHVKSWLGFALFGVLRCGPVNYGSTLVFPVRCGANSRPDLRTEPEDGRSRFGSPRSCERRCGPVRLACARLGSACGSDYTVAGGVLGLVLPGGVGLVSDSGWLAEGLTLDENLASTSSVPTVTAFLDVVFFLGGVAVELIALLASWRRSPGENLRSGGARSDDGSVLDTTSFLEASSWRP